VGVLTRSITNVPGLIAEMLIIAVAVACFVGLHALLQRRLSTEMLRRHNEVAGYLFSAVGVLYAVLLGFVVVVVWQKYDEIVSNVQSEVDAVGNLYHSVDGYDLASRTMIRKDLDSYARIVATIEWQAMARNQDVPETADGVLEDAAYRVDTFAPRDFKGFTAQQASIGNMQRLYDARRQRLIHSDATVPPILWFALISGALAMVGFCYIFGVENRPAQLMMTAILVALIGILFAVIGEFSTPFSGSVSISNDGWVYLEQRTHFIR
jgi:Protein of unknown function (DUF4239)